MQNKSFFRRREPGISAGATSILLIFVLLALVSFAALSFVSANADYKLTAKVTERTSAYYEAVGRIETELADLDRELQTLFLSSSDRDAYFAGAGHENTLSAPVQGNQYLEAVVEILYPESDEDAFMRVVSYKVVDRSDM